MSNISNEENKKYKRPLVSVRENCSNLLKKKIKQWQLSLGHFFMQYLANISINTPNNPEKQSLIGGYGEWFHLKRTLNS